MQILHPLSCTVQRYAEEIADVDRYRPDHCPQCEARDPLTGHGFYCRTLVDVAWEGIIRVRRYLCHSCKRTTSLLPDFAFPWLRFSVSVIALFLVRPPAQRPDPAGCGASCRASNHALPARAVLDSPFPKASAGSEPGTGSVGSPAGGGELCIESPADARIDWMDRRPSLPVFATARASAGLARVSGSVRVTNHAARGLPDLSRSPT
jgi:hypothetical protein